MKNLPPREWIFGLPLKKANDEVSEVTLDRNDSIIEKFPEERKSKTFRGELDTAVSQYLSQVKELGFYKEENSRDTQCQFTTFKTPALPKKSNKYLSLPDEKLLDVKFKLTEDINDNSYTSENSGPTNNSLTNPLYASLGDCSTGNSDNKLREDYYENINQDNSDEDHIYENVESSFHLYDTVVNPPKPKLPPKLGRIGKGNNEIKTSIPKSLSFSSPTPYEKYSRVRRSPVKLKGHIDSSRAEHSVEGSETSDLGSSGSEDTNSVEDWPLPPFPLEASTDISEDIPLPPPPFDTTLEFQEENSKEVKDTDCSKVNERNYTNNLKNQSEQLNSKHLDTKVLHIQESDSANSNTIYAQVCKESFSKKEVRSKIPTLNRGVNGYNKRIVTDFEDNIIRPKKEVNSTINKENSSVRHSVVIELKDPNSSGPKSLDSSGGTQIKEHLSSFDIKLNTKHNNDFHSLNLYKNIENSTLSVSCYNTSDSNEQVIEISEDGSWEMKETLENTSMDLNCDPLANEIDPFTGFPIGTPLPEEDPVVSSKKSVKEYIEPEIYFDNQKEVKDTFESLSVSNKISETKISIAKIFSNSAENATNKVIIKETINNNANECISNDEKENNDDTKNQKLNIGAAIMEGYEKDLKRKKDSLNLPDVSLLEFGDSVKDLEMQRKSVIEQMTVKAKKKDSWIRTFRSSSEAVKESTKQDGTKTTPKGISVKKQLFENSDKSSDINESNNKSKTKLIITTSNNKKINSNEKLGSKLNQINNICNKNKNINNNKKDNKTKVNEIRECKSEMKEGTTPREHQVKISHSNKQNENTKNKGEIDSESILTKKAETKSYWESKMLAVDENGWEPVANVKFRSESQISPDDESSGAVPPPPEFSLENGNINFESLESTEDISESSIVSQPMVNERPSRQYIYGSDEEIKPKVWKVDEEDLNKEKMSSHENVIEAEIRQQQLREEALRRENDLRSREKTGGASSPSSHASDEGFVERPIEEAPSPPLTSSSPSVGYTHTIKGHDGEPIIYDAVSPSSEYFEKNIPNSSSSEAKIAMEIRELKEREAELRALRELREREQELRSMKDCPATSRNLPVEPEDDVDLELERGSASSRDMLDDHLASFTTTTDEGNYSECGDPVSSEDKSSEGSNSRIMSPDIHTFGGQRKVTVKPFEDDEAEQQPVYTQMKKESVIEREIRLGKEREEAFRREKGLIPISPTTKKNNTETLPTITSDKPSKPQIQTSSTLPIPSKRTASKVISQFDQINGVSGGEDPPKRKSQLRITTNLIQQEIEETAQRERELRNAGTIKTLSEDTVDSKVTRLSDFTSDKDSSTTARASPVSSTSTSSISSLHSSPPRSPFSPTTPVNKGNPPSFTSPSSPYTPPSFTPSPNKRPPAPTRLTRSLSTNNLSLSGMAPGGSTLRMPTQKGLMQKFIASRGKLSTSAFAPPSSNAGFNGLTTNGIPTRPMRLSPKMPTIRRDPESDKEAESKAKIYRRTHATAEEKIQEELRDMKKREEELRRIRARNLARSQPNLAGYDDDDAEDEMNELPSISEGVDSSSFLHEMNGLRSALSNPNLLDEEHSQTTQQERGVRRRSALIAQWEGRIQQTTES